MKDYYGNDATRLKDKKLFLFDMDGVIYHGSKILDCVKEFVNWLLEGPRELFVPSNNYRLMRK